jgi:hypothetical protein
MTSSPGAVRAMDDCRDDTCGSHAQSGVSELPGPAVDSSARFRRRSSSQPAQLPLWFAEPPNEVKTRPAKAKMGEGLSGRDAGITTGDGRVLLTDDAVRRLHVAVLHNALGVLKSKARGSTAEK